MNYTELVNKINNDPDFILAPQHQYSLRVLLSKYPDGIDNWNLIARYLNISPSKAKDLYQSAISKIKNYLITLPIDKPDDNGETECDS